MRGFHLTQCIHPEANSRFGIFDSQLVCSLFPCSCVIKMTPLEESMVPRALLIRFTMLPYIPNQVAWGPTGIPDNSEISQMQILIIC